jgi:hypothetical protein
MARHHSCMATQADARCAFAELPNDHVALMPPVARNASRVIDLLRFICANRPAWRSRANCSRRDGEIAEFLSNQGFIAALWRNFAGPRRLEFAKVAKM